MVIAKQPASDHATRDTFMLRALFMVLLAAPSVCFAAAPALRWQPLNEPGCGGWITSLAVSPHDARHVLMGGDVLGAAASDDRGESWQPAFGFASWEIADFTFHPTDPRIVWVGTMSGPYVSADGGRTWQPRRQGLPPVGSHHYSAPIQKVLFDPADAARLLAFGGSHRRLESPGKPLWGSVWESRDAGASWKPIATIGGEASGIVAAAFAPASSTLLYAAADGAGFVASTDGGRTWTPRTSGLPSGQRLNAIAVHPTKKEILWAALDNGRHPEDPEFTPGGIYKTTDGGLTWRPASRGLAQHRTRDANTTSRYRALAVSPSDANILLTGDAGWWGAAVYRSADGGDSWQAVATRKNIDTAYNAGLCATVITFDPRDAAVAFVAGSEYALRTLDGGKTWTDVTSRRAADGAWAGRGFSGLCAEGFKFDPRDPRRAVLLAMDGGNFWQSRDRLASWVHGDKGFPTWGGASDVAFSGADTMFVTLGQFGSFGGIARTRDGGRTWTILESFARGLPNLSARASARGVHVLPDDSNVAWAAIDGQLYATTDGGDQWKVVHAGPGLEWIAAVPGRPRTFFVGGKEGVYRTDDGAKFALLAGGPKNVGHLAVDASTPPRVYAVSWRSKTPGLWRHDGAAWQRLRDDPYIYDVAVDPTDPRRVAIMTNDHPFHDVAGATGVWISSDAGATWAAANDGLPMLRGTCLTFNPHDPEQIVVGTLGRGYFTARWPRR